MSRPGFEALDLTKWIVSALCALVLYMRSSVAFLLIFGGCISALIVKGLKRIIKQPRPHQPDGQDFGMPSSHAASVCFFATSVAVYQPRIAGVISWIFAVDACFRRYQNRQHSVAQLALGCAIGIINCSLTALTIHSNATAVTQFDVFLKSTQGAGLSLFLACAAGYVVFEKELRKIVR